MVEARINFNVSSDLRERLDKIPWGMRSQVLRRLTEFACDIYDRHGEIGLGAIMAKEFKLVSDKISGD